MIRLFPETNTQGEITGTENIWASQEKSHAICIKENRNSCASIRIHKQSLALENVQAYDVAVQGSETNQPSTLLLNGHTLPSLLHFSNTDQCTVLSCLLAGYKTASFT